MTTTQSALARELGLSRQRVRQYVEAGMPRRADGKLDHAKALAWVKANREEDHRARHQASATASSSAGATREGMSLNEVRRAHEIVKTQERRLQLQRLRGEVVDRDTVVRRVFDLARQERDAWLLFPTRVGAIIAAEVGADPAKLQVALEREVRAYLGQLATIEAGVARLTA